jgi:hypothetical protein
VNGYKKNEGSIQILYKGKKGFICGEKFTYNTARIICKTLGFGYVNAFSLHGFFGGCIFVIL